MIELPSERPLERTKVPNAPYVLVGDKGFALNRNTLTICGSNVSLKVCEHISPVKSMKVCGTCFRNFKH
jgi:hypothetical protein